MCWGQSLRDRPLFASQIDRSLTTILFSSGVRVLQIWANGLPTDQSCYAQL